VFDFALIIIFPTFLALSWLEGRYAPVLGFLFLINCHIAIAICRYGYSSEISWPVWADVLAILCGVMLIVSAFEPPFYLSLILILSGLVLCYGHIRKILCPDLPYYFGNKEETVTPTVPTDGEMGQLIY
tara:strand:- start:1045 stop:1431 length:387 start_codon:yes stop_codon:yes gene_type:complete